MTEPPSTVRKDETIRDLHAAITRIRNLDSTPQQVDADSDLGRAYTRGWQDHRDAVDTALLGVPASHDTGPSVREAAADDRSWGLEKAGE